MKNFCFDIVYDCSKGCFMNKIYTKALQNLNASMQHIEIFYAKTKSEHLIRSWLILHKRRQFVLNKLSK